MGELKDITNPIVLEERKLELKFRKKLVMKKMAYEEEKSKKTQIRYDKILQALKEIEVKVQLIKGSPADKAASLKQFKNTLEVVRNEFKLQEEEKQRMQYQITFKTEIIDENISKLMDDLMKKSQILLYVKSELQSVKVEYQKKELKNLAYAKLNQKFIESIKEKSQEEQKLFDKQIDFNKNRINNINAGKNL